MTPALCGRSLGRLALLVVVIATASACQDSIIKALGPENREIATVLTDSLRFEAWDLDNVTDTRTWNWTITGPVAAVFHRSFVHHGQGRLTIIDAAGDTVYRMIPLEYQQDNQTAAGQAGVWTVQLELFGARGRVDFSLARAP
ncbi:MAG TPA: hypothetical protein VGU74_12920 [Gemmatimonadales bacterium]|nr:hypothetical protein [Gemmatimonadales bacterium]